MAEQTDKYILDKSIWTHEDFEQMGWHDSNIYGLTVQKSENNWASDLVLDIDYIFKWVKPIPPLEAFTFWVAPCTLIFKGSFDLLIDFKTDGGGLNLIEIVDLHIKSKLEQEKNLLVYEWKIELQQGIISLKSYGFEQYVRAEPIHTNGQVLSLEQRGGINFEKTRYDK